TFVVPRSAAEEDRLMELVLEAGGEDVRADSDSYEIVASPEVYEGVRKALEDGKIPVENSELGMHAKTSVHLEGKKAQQCLSLMEALEEQEDVQKVSANFDIDESELGG